MTTNDDLPPWGSKRECEDGRRLASYGFLFSLSENADHFSVSEYEGKKQPDKKIRIYVKSPAHGKATYSWSREASRQDSLQIFPASTRVI